MPYMFLRDFTKSLMWISVSLTARTLITLCHTIMVVKREQKGGFIFQSTFKEWGNDSNLQSLI